jgi:hypothetical protein
MLAHCLLMNPTYGGGPVLKVLLVFVMHDLHAKSHAYIVGTSGREATMLVSFSIHMSKLNK